MLPVKRRQRGCRDEKLLSPEISEFGELTRYSTWKAISPDFTMVREGGLCGVKGPLMYHNVLTYQLGRACCFLKASMVDNYKTEKAKWAAGSQMTA